MRWNDPKPDFMWHGCHRLKGKSSSKVAYYLVLGKGRKADLFLFTKFYIVDGTTVMYCPFTNNYVAFYYPTFWGVRWNLIVFQNFKTKSIWILERLVLRFCQEVTLLWHVSMTGYVRHTLETTFLLDISMLWGPRSVSFQLHGALGLEIFLVSFTTELGPAHGVMASRSKIKAKWFPRYISPF